MPSLTLFVKALLESVQRRAVNMVSTLPRTMTYEEKLVSCGLTSLEERRIRGMAIETYRALTGVSQVPISHFWELARPGAEEGAAAGTRARTGYLNLKRKEGNTETRQNFWSFTVENWNGLLDYTKMATSVNNFKSLYDSEMMSRNQKM
jgi:hypothetical protein